MKDRKDLHETRDQPISRSVKDKETWILTGRYRRCDYSQEATVFNGILPDMDTVVVTPTNS